MRNYFITIIISFISLILAAQECFGQPETDGSRIAANDIKKTLLLEEFTSQSCGNCPQAQNILHEKIKDYADNIAVITHHSGYSADIFSVKESWDLCWFYNAKSTYAPAIMVDRCTVAGGGENTPVFHPDLLTAADIEAALATPAEITVNIESEYNPNSRRVTVTVWGNATAQFDCTNPALTVMITESGYEARQNGADDGFVHNNFPRAMLSEETLGDPITLDGENGYRKQYSYTVPLSYKAYDPSTGDKTGDKTEAHPDMMEIVAFVANADSSSPTNCRVANAAKVKLGESKVSTRQTAESSYTVGTDGRHIVLKGEYSSYAVYSITGTPVTDRELPKGIYLVKVTDSKGRTTTHKAAVR